MRASIDRAASVPGRVTAEVYRGGVEIIDRLADEWRELCDAGGSDLPFVRPEWIAAHVRAFSPAGELLLITARVEGRLSLVLPLLVEHSRFYGLPVRKLRSPTNSHSPAFDLVLRHDDEVAADVAWELLKDLPDWDMIEMQDVPDGGALEVLLRLAREDGWPTGRWESWQSPVLTFPGAGITLNKALASVNSKFRSTVRRHKRKLEELGPLRLRRVDAPEMDELARFYDLEQSGWKGKEGTAIACSSETRQFYDELAHTAADHGYLALYLLESGDRLVATQYGLTHHRRHFPLKSAFDESLREYGAGQVIVLEVVGDLVDRGVTELHFFGQSEEWKRSWTSEAEPLAWRYAFRKNPYGRALHAAKFVLLQNARALKHRISERRRSSKAHAEGRS